MKIKFKYIMINLFSMLMPSTVEMHLDNIHQSVINNDYIEAYTQFETAISKFDASAVLYFKGANLALSLDKLDDASIYFNKAIELDLKNKDYRSAQEKLSLLRNDITNARKTFDSGRIDESIKEYEELCIKYPKNGIVFYNLGLIYKSNEQYAKAVNNYKIADNLNQYEHKYKLAIKAIAQQMIKDGDTEYRRREFAYAIEKYKQAINFDSGYTVSYNKLASAYLKIKEYDNSKIYLEQSLQLDPIQEKTEKLLGDVLLRLGDINSAISHYEIAISINSNYAKAYYSLGKILFDQKNDFTAAEKSLQTALLLAPEYAKAHGTLGAVYQSQGKYQLAIESFISSINIDNKSHVIHWRLSNVYNLLNKYELAKASAKYCLQMNRNYAAAYYELGLAEKSLGNKVASLAAFEKAKRDRNWRKLSEYQIKYYDANK